MEPTQDNMQNDASQHDMAPQSGGSCKCCKCCTCTDGCDCAGEGASSDRQAEFPQP